MREDVQLTPTAVAVPPTEARSAAGAENVTAGPSAGHPRRWLILCVVFGAEIMDMLDGTVVNVASATIHRSLGTSTTELQWIISGYALAMAVGLLIGGRLGDIYGRRRIFLTGMAGFTVASAVCGAAPDTTVLITARLVQGLAGALMMPQGFGLIRESFAREELPKVFGLFGPVLGMGAAVGPLIGGGLIAAHIFHDAWRSVFLVNVPIGVLAIAAGIILLPQGAARQARTLDLGGAALAAVASLALVYPLIQGRDAGWPAWTFISLAASVVFFTAFGRHITTTKREPLIVPSLFRRRGYTSGAGLLMLMFGGMIGAMLAITLFFQLGERFSAIHAGLTLMPFSVGMILAAPIASTQMERLGGRRLIQGGIGLAFAGFVAAALVITTSGHVSTLGFAAPLLLVGMGLGLFAMSAFSTILAAVTDFQLGSASGSLEAIQQLGGAVGVAVIGTVYFSALSHHGFHSALGDALWWAAGAALLALVLTPLVPRAARPESDLLA